MTVRIRLQRHGAKKRPFYRVVVADQRAPRDGRFIELLGTYDPLQEPPIVRLKKDRVNYWVGVGAQPSDTATYLISLLDKEGAVIDLSDSDADKSAADARKAEADERVKTARAQAAKALQAAAEEGEKAAAAPAATEEAPAAEEAAADAPEAKEAATEEA